jgi:hypothetical protein
MNATKFILTIAVMIGSSSLPATGTHLISEGSVVTDFQLSQVEIDNVNNLLNSLSNQETATSIKEKFKSIRQPKAVGGKEFVKADKRDAKKIISHQYRIYVYRQDIELVKMNDVLVVFWFINNHLSKITSSSPDIHIPKAFHSQ